METDSTIVKINNRPLRFTCPKCRSHKLYMVEYPVRHVTPLVEVDDAGVTLGDGWFDDQEDCPETYFQCAGTCEKECDYVLCDENGDVITCHCGFVAYLENQRSEVGALLA